MMSRRYGLLTLWILAGLHVANAEPGSSHELRNGLWYDGNAFESRTLYMVDETLTHQRPDVVDRVLDLRSGYVVPPFGDAHTHRPASPVRVEQDSRFFLDAGIFYIMNHGNIAGYHGDLSRLLSSPDTVDATFANAILTSPQSHSVELWQRLVARGAFPDVTVATLDGDAYIIIETLEDLNARWAALLASRPDFLKIMLQHTEEYDLRRVDPQYFGHSGLDPSIVEGIVTKAHDAGLRVSAHIETAADFRLAVDSGVDIIAHLPGYDVALSDDIDRYRLSLADAEAAAARDVVVLTTTLLSRSRSEDQPTKLARMESNHRANLSRLRDARVRIAVGSDQFSKHSVDELVYLASLGVFSPQDLLNMIAIVTPAVIREEPPFAGFDDGSRADFIVLEENPLSDIENVREVILAVKAGVFLE